MTATDAPLAFDGVSLAYELAHSADRKTWKPAEPATPSIAFQRRYLDWRDSILPTLGERRRLGTACVSDQPDQLKAFCKDHGMPYEPRDMGTTALSNFDMTIHWGSEVEVAEVTHYQVAQQPAGRAYEAVRVPRSQSEVFEYVEPGKHRRYTIAKLPTGNGVSLYLTDIGYQPKSMLDVMLEAQRLHDLRHEFKPTDSYYSVVVPTVRYKHTVNLGWLVGIYSPDYHRQLTNVVQQYSISLGNHNAPADGPSDRTTTKRWPSNQPRVALRFNQPLFGWFALDDVPVVQGPFCLPPSTWKQLPLPTIRR